MNNSLRGAIKSRMMWLGLLSLLFGAAYNTLPQIQQLLPKADLSWLISAIGGVTMVLRWLTTDSLEDKGNANIVRSDTQ